MQQRTTLFAVFAIAAAALTWFLMRPGSSHDTVSSQAERGAESAASASTQPSSGGASALRPGPGTVGTRPGAFGTAGAAGARENAASAPQADVDVATGPYPRAPRPSPMPNVESRSAEANALGDGSAAPSEWSGLGVEAIPPPRIGRDARDDDAPAPSDQPPDPTAFAVAGQVPAGASTPESTPAPQPGNRSNDAPELDGTDAGGPPQNEPAPSSSEAVPSRGPLTPEQIADRVDAALAGLPPEQQEALAPVITKEEAAKAAFAGGLSN